MRVHVSTVSDLSAGTNTHIWGPLPPGSISPHYESSAEHKWEHGKAKHKFTTTVRHRGLLIALEGHDGGMFQPHGPPTWSNFANGAKVDLNGKREITYSASTVRLNGKPCGCADSDQGIFITTCGDPVSFASGNTLTCGYNTVHIGMTAMDVLLGDANVVAETTIEAVSFVTSAFEGPGSVAETLLGLVGANPGGMSAKDVKNGVLSIAKSWNSGWRDPVKIVVKKDGPFGGSETGITYEPSTGKISLKQEAEAALPGTKALKEEKGVSYSPDDGFEHIQKLPEVESLKPPDDSGDWEFDDEHGWVKK